MKKRFLAIITVFILSIGLLFACGQPKKSAITEAEAQKIALESAGLAISQVTDIHTHLITQNDAPCYQVHMTTDTGDVTVVINAATGEVIGNG